MDFLCGVGPETLVAYAPGRSRIEASFGALHATLDVDAIASPGAGAD